MEQYAVYYRDIRIGTLRVEGGKHWYLPCEAGVRAAEKHTFLTKEMREGTPGFEEPIPFFQNRLYQMKRWNMTEMNYATDYFLIRKL